jgi:branched-chain amino acid transport system substrate-binding protein
VLFPKQYKEKGPRLPLIGGGSSVDETILPQLGDEAVGTVTTMCYSGALNTPTNKRFIQAFAARYPNEQASFYSESSYTAGMWINSAVNRLNGNVSDKTKLLEALKHVELQDAPRGPVKLDDRANPVQNVYVRKVERVNGKLQNSVIHTFPGISQFWTYNPATFLKQPNYSKNFPPCKYCAP